MAVSEYGQVILHNYKLFYLIKFQLFVLCFVLSFCKSYEVPAFKLHSGSHFVSQYESIISIVDINDTSWIDKLSYLCNSISNIYGKRNRCFKSIPRFTFPFKDRRCQCMAKVTQHVGRLDFGNCIYLRSLSKSRLHMLFVYL